MDDVIRRLNAWEDDMYTRIYNILDYHAARATEIMKREARWTDRTGNARQSLTAERDTMSIVLYGGMEYSPFLETRHTGRYAILMPTAERIAPQVVADVARLRR